MRGQRVGVGFITFALLAAATGCSTAQQRVATGVAAVVEKAATSSAGAFRAPDSSGAVQPASSVATMLPGGVPIGMHYEMPTSEASLSQIALVAPDDDAQTVPDVLRSEPQVETTVAPGESVELSVVDPNGLAATEALVVKDDFQSVAASWPVGADAAQLQVRFRRADGTWTEWTELTDDGAGPDVGQQDLSRVRAGTDTVFYGDAEAVQIATLGEVPEALPNDSVDVALVGSPTPVLVPDSATSGAVAQADDLAVRDAVYRPGTASTQQVADITPRVITRETWGARKPTATWSVAPSVEHAVVHHTAGSNSYETQAQAMQQIRNDQEYHQRTRGWADIGYNFIVDKWGNIYEGAAGSISQAQVGAHTAGFNTGSVGISMLGDYMSLTPPNELLRSVAAVAEWKLSAYGVKPDAKITLTVKASNTKKWKIGKKVTVDAIAAHRDLGSTDCPGDQGYAQMAKIREIAAFGPDQYVFAPEPVASEPVAPEPTTPEPAAPEPFDPGNLLSDEVLYNAGAMTAEQIADFLKVRGANCTSKPGYTCLTDYRETTTTRDATAFCPGVYEGAADETAAQIIAKASQACGINPQVLLVTLQKEQGLLTNARSPEVYAKALGFRCPTSGGCEAQYAGFANQVYSAASRFKQYAAEPHKFPMKVGETNTIPYGASGCGSAQVLIRNQATASLYNYTPQVPKPGESGKCAPNGNLDFVNFFTQWFGSPITGPVQPEAAEPQIAPDATAAPAPETAPSPSDTPTPTETAQQVAYIVAAPKSTEPTSSAQPSESPEAESAKDKSVDPEEATAESKPEATSDKADEAKAVESDEADSAEPSSAETTEEKAGSATTEDTDASAAVQKKVVRTGKPYKTIGTVAISGIQKVDYKLTAKVSDFSPTPSDYTYQWLRGDDEIADATEPTYKVTPADAGKVLMVAVTANLAGYHDEQVSAETDPIPAKYFTDGSVALSGTAKVGQTLTAKLSDYTPKPTRYVYVWLRNGAAIKDATTASYKLKEADRGKQISVRVTAERDDYNNRVRTTDPIVVK